MTIEVIPVEGMPRVRAGDDLAALVLASVAASGLSLRAGDVVVVSSKIVSKAEGRTLASTSRDTAVASQTVRVVAERRGPRGTTRIVESRSGPVLAAAGVDASNVDPGTVLLLPADPDAAARALRKDLTAATGQLLGVIVSDTAGRPWRDGQIDLAIGAAGITVTDDLRGRTDPYGNPLEVTVRALADELASAADLVKAKVREVPVALVRGLTDVVTPDDGPGSRQLLRGRAGDWFALGHAEAVRACLGVPPDTPGIDPLPLIPDDATARLRRAAAVALAAPDPFRPTRSSLPSPGCPPSPGAVPTIEFDVDGAGRNTAGNDIAGPGTDDPGTARAVVRPARSPEASSGTPPGTSPGTAGVADRASFGALVQRVLAAAWSEGLTTSVTPLADGAVEIAARSSGQ